MADLALWVEALIVAAPGAWLAIGAFENLRAPRANGDMVAEVLAMTRMKAELPDYYALVSANRIESPRIHRFAFAAIVVTESVSALVMLVGALALAGAALGLWGATLPRGIAARARLDSRWSGQARRVARWSG